MGSKLSIKTTFIQERKYFSKVKFSVRTGWNISRIIKGS
jgi:hypothetical protein